jgi:deoxyribonuclease V
MNLAVDVHYLGDELAVAAGVAFADWRSDRIARTQVVRIRKVRPYSPGNFFERELPCLLAVIDQFGELPDTIVIDGYVTLGEDDRDGLGAHLYVALERQVSVIGVAKSRFAGTPVDREVFRGESARPLYVTSRRIALEAAKQLILGMHGAHRVPTLLAAADQACRAAMV